MVLVAQLEAIQTTIGMLEKRIVMRHRSNQDSNVLPGPAIKNLAARWKDGCAASDQVPDQ